MEVGMGHGGYRKFLPSSSQYLGVDIDPGCIEKARKLYPNDTFVVADVTDPELAQIIGQKHIDTVLCVNVLEHIENDKAAIHNMMSVLPPGWSPSALGPSF